MQRTYNYSAGSRKLRARRIPPAFTRSKCIVIRAAFAGGVRRPAGSAHAVFAVRGMGLARLPGAAPGDAGGTGYPAPPAGRRALGRLALPPYGKTTRALINKLQ